MKKILLILFICAVGMKIKSQVIDSTFGIPTSLDPCCIVYSTTGCNFGGFEQAFLTVHMDDGRIILAGDTRWQGESDFAIARLMPDGQYDQTAGPDGQVRIDLDYPNDSCFAATRYQNDRILMGGCVWKPGIGYVNLIARIDFDGNLDASFGNGGHLTIDLPVAHEMITKILSQTDGKILVGDHAFYGPSFDFPDSVDVFVGRLLPNGQVDSTFGENGFFYHRWERRCNVALLGDLSLDKQGRIVLTGGSYDPYPCNYDGDDWCYHNIFLSRYLSDGQPDVAFGIKGSLELEYTRNGRGSALLHYDDGRILLAGAAGEPNGRLAYVFLARFMPDGTPDPSFADNGRFRKPIIFEGLISGGMVEPFGLLRMRDRILVMGLYEINGDPIGVGAICLKENGEFDLSFGNGGRFNAFPELLLSRAYFNQISTTNNNNFFFSGYTRILQPNNMVIVKVRWDQTSNTQEYSVFSEIKIYPNPARETLYWQGLPIGQEARVQLWDLHGRLVYEDVSSRAETRLPAGLPSGIYVARLLDAAAGRVLHVGKVAV